MKSAWTKAAAAALLAATLGVGGIALRANASTDVIGGGVAHDCAVRALAGESSAQALDVCNLAIENEMMSRSDEAKTLVNRSVIFLRRGQLERSRLDLMTAEKLEPTLAEVFVNRGALYIHLHRYQDALDEINRGIAMNPSEPEKAYYNRGLAYEMLDNPKAAYLDYRKASQLNPKWPDPVKAMGRFTVKTAGS